MGGVKTGRADACRAREGPERLKTGSETTKFAKNAKNGQKIRGFSRKTGNFRSQDPVRSVFLAKDAKGAKKHQRYPKPLGELGALCENPKMALKWPKSVKNGLNRPRNGPRRSFSDHRGSSGPKTPSGPFFSPRTRRAPRSVSDTQSLLANFAHFARTQKWPQNGQNQ